MGEPINRIVREAPKPHVVEKLNEEEKKEESRDVYIPPPPQKGVPILPARSPYQTGGRFRLIFLAEQAPNVSSPYIAPLPDQKIGVSAEYDLIKNVTIGATAERNKYAFPSHLGTNEESHQALTADVTIRFF